MNKNFQPDGLPILIGSLPLADHDEAARLVLQYTPEIPLWVQLPVYAEEGMIAQFMPGLPGFTVENGKAFMNAGDESFSDDILAFYEEYMAVSEAGADINTSRFVLKPDTAKGFFTFKNHIRKLDTPPIALKGQITGPITFTTAVKDQNGRAVFYDDQCRDAAIKLLALKAAWQVRQLSQFKCPVILFLDEPALAGFGSSEFISISKQDVKTCLEEVISAVHAEGGLAGIHVCANTEWDVVMDTSVDIVNFDAYSFFDRFILYPDEIKKFLESGRFIAWGIVPTSEPEHIEKETPDSLSAMWESHVKEVEKLGLDRERILNQSFISPSCGTGSLSLKHAVQVLELTRDVSGKVRGR
jgi:hypothetical protein